MAVMAARPSARYRVRRDRRDGPLRRFLRGVVRDSSDRNVSHRVLDRREAAEVEDRHVCGPRNLARENRFQGRITGLRQAGFAGMVSAIREGAPPRRHGTSTRRKVSPHQRAQPAAFEHPPCPSASPPSSLMLVERAAAPLAADRRQPAEMWDRSNCFPRLLVGAQCPTGQVFARMGTYER